MKPLLLIGGGGHCRSCIDVIEAERRFEILGIIQPKPNDAESVFGYSILGDDEDIPALLRKSRNALVTVGQIKTPSVRIGLFELLKKWEAHMPVIIAPKAHVSLRSEIGEGTIVMHGAIVNANAKIGVNTIVNSQALVEHDTLIEDHCHVSTGARINGAVTVGTGTFIGSGAILRDGVRIGANVLIGSGCTIMHDVPAGSVVRRGS